MKNLFLISFVLLGVIASTSQSFAAKMNCNKFSKEIESFQSESIGKQKQLSTIETQLLADSKAVNDFNKNCRGTSNPNCNPTMFNIISGQMSVHTEQRQKLADAILDAQSKQELAIKNLKMCQSLKIEKSVR